MTTFKKKKFMKLANAEADNYKLAMQQGRLANMIVAGCKLKALYEVAILHDIEFSEEWLAFLEDDFVTVAD